MISNSDYATDQLESNQYFWCIDFDISNPSADLKYKGDMLDVYINKDKNETEIEIYINLPFERKLLLRALRNHVYVYTFNRNKIPIFYRIMNKRCYLSNVIHHLIERGENVLISLEDLCSVISNANGVQSCLVNIFKSIIMLKSSSVYKVSNEGLEFHSSVFNEETSCTNNELLELILDKYRLISEKNDSIHLFISGGYDSRLELALLLYWVEKYKNRIYLHHYFSSYDNNYNLVCEIAKVFHLNHNFVDAKRNRIDGIERLSRDLQFILLNSGNFQIGLYSFLPVCYNIKKLNENGLVIGGNVGPLKGRSYSRIKNIPDDLIKFNLPTPMQLNNGAKEICLGQINYRRYRDELMARVDDIYSGFRDIRDHYNKIELMDTSLRYSGLISRRMQPLMMFLKMPFLLENDEVCQNFMGLNYKERRYANFIKYAIKHLDPRLFKIKFISGNYEEIINPYLYLFRTYTKAIYRRLKLEKIILSEKEVDDGIKMDDCLVDINEKELQSDVTKKLKKSLEIKLNKHQNLREALSSRAFLFNYQLLIYLRTLEKLKNCRFEMNY